MSPRATVVILTFNGEEFLQGLLDSATTQVTDFDYDVLVIDSGSTDATLEIVRGFEDVRLHEIPNAEFGHGRTRNLAVTMTDAEFVVFLTQDAIPAHDGWLAEMIRPFDAIGPKLACVFGKQVPRPDCCPTVKRDLLTFFGSFGADHCVSVQYANPRFEGEALRDAVGFFSDVNSAVRRSVLVATPYADVNYAEDQMFGRAVVAAGMLKAYSPLGSVHHSHSYPPITYMRRIYDEFDGLRALAGRGIRIPLRQVAFGWIRPTLGDWRFVARDRSYGPKAKLKWFVLAPSYNLLRRVAMRAAMNSRSARVRRWLSLEGRTRAGQPAGGAATASTSIESS